MPTEPIPGTGGAEGEPTPSGFRAIQTEIERLGASPSPTDIDRVNELQEKRKEIGAEAARLGFLDDAKRRLDNACDRVGREVDPEEFLDRVVEKAEELEDRAKKLSRNKSQFDEEKFGGVVEYYTQQAGERIRFEYRVATGVPRDPAEDNFHRPEDWEYAVDPAKFAGRPTTPPAAARGATAGPTRRAGGIPGATTEAGETARKEFSQMSIEEQSEFIRERVAAIRRQGQSYSQLRLQFYDNPARELASLIGIMKPEAKAEFDALKAILDVGRDFRGVKKSEQALEKSGDVDNDVLQTIFRIKDSQGVPIIAQSFKLLEQFAEEYADKNTTPAKKQALLRKIGWIINGKTETEADLLKDTFDPHDLGTLPNNFWAVQNAEDLFLMSGRAASHGDKTLGYADSLLNLRRWVREKEFSKKFFTKNINANGDIIPGTDGGGQYINSFIDDFFVQTFWKEKWGPDQKMGYVVEVDGVEQIFENLSDIPLDKVEFVEWGKSNKFSSYWKDMQDAESVKDLLTDLLSHPIVEDFEKPNQQFKHLKGEEHDAAVCNYLAAIFEFNRNRGLPYPLDHSAARDEGLNWRGLSREDMNNYINDFINKKYLSPVSFASLTLREAYGRSMGLSRLKDSREWARYSKISGSIALSAIGEGLKFLVSALLKPSK